MAQKSKSGKYLNLEDVRVSYDPKSDIFSLTAADSELKELGGLKLDVSHSSKAHGALRKLLKRHGLIKGDPWAPLTEDEEFKLFEANADPRLVLLGTNVNGEPEGWAIDKAQNLWIYGGVGSGSSFPKRAILIHGLSHGWDIRALDTTGVELPKELSPGRNQSAILQELKSLEGLIEERKKQLSRGEFQTVLIMLEDIMPIFLAAKSEDPNGIYYSSLALAILKSLMKISSEGWIVDIHVVVGVGTSWKNEEYGFEEYMEKLRSEQEMYQSSGYLIMGKMGRENLPANIRGIYRPFRSSILGRGHLVDYRGFEFQREFHALYLTQEKLNELMIAHQKAESTAIAVGSERESNRFSPRNLGWRRR